MRVVAGSGRSGTTWVLDCLADANDLRPVFEPLKPEVSEAGRRHAHRLIEPGDSHPDLEAYLELVQRRNYRSLWTTYRGVPERLLPGIGFLSSIAGLRLFHQRWSRFLESAWKLHKASRRGDPLVKFIRANLALGWMVRTLGARAVLIVRHPCAVVESKHRLGKITKIWDPQPLIEQFRDDRNFNERTGSVYLDLLSSRLTEHEALTLLWVIENQRAIGRAAQLGYTVIYYEELMREPEAQWPRVCSALALTQVPSVGNRLRPSQQSSADSGVDSDSSAASWMARMSAGQMREVQAVLDRTGFARYHISSALPIAPNRARHSEGAS
jgi:hypothetical protein